MRATPLNRGKRAGHEERKEVARNPPNPKPTILKVSFLPIILS